MSRAEPLSSPDALHEAGAREKSNIVSDAAMIFVGGAVMYLIMAALLTALYPRGIERRSINIPTVLLHSFELLQVSNTTMAQFLALAGAILALNRFDRFSQTELGTEHSARLTVRLNYRSSIQVLLTLIAATAPYCAITRIVFHIGERDWQQDAVGTLVLCIVLWLILLLSSPFGMHFGLETIQSRWRLGDIIFQAGTLEKRWQNRWGMTIMQPRVRRNISLRIVGIWSSISSLIAALLLTLMLIEGSARQILATSQFGYIALAYIAGILSIGFALLVVSCALAMLSIGAADHGWRLLQQILRFLSYAISPAVMAGFTVATQASYYPITVSIIVLAAIHVASVRGLLDDRPMVPQPWNPLRQLVLGLREWSHARAHERWSLLSKVWTSRIAELPSKEAKDELRRAHTWRDRHHLQLPFIPNSRSLLGFNVRKRLRNQ